MKRGGKVRIQIQNIERLVSMTAGQGVLLIKRQGVVLAELVFSPPWAGQSLAIVFSLATRQHNGKRRWL
jgi:hypothetical protein